MNTVVNRGRSLSTAMALLLAAFLVLAYVPGRADAAKATGRERMLSLTNQAREQRDKTELALNKKLSHLAKKHSRAMAKQGSLFHTDSATLVRALRGYDWSLGGENVGEASSLGSLQKAFMQSKEHRRNILRTQFSYAAIGVFHSQDRVWVTVIFYG